MRHCRDLNFAIASSFKALTIKSAVVVKPVCFRKISGNPRLFNYRDEIVQTQAKSKICSISACVFFCMIVYYVYERKFNTFKKLCIQYQLSCGVDCEISQEYFISRDRDLS